MPELPERFDVISGYLDIDVPPLLPDPVLSSANVEPVSVKVPEE